MKTIYKYPLEVISRQTITMPEGARVLYVAVQDEIACLWAAVDTERRSVNRIFVILGTGHEFPESESGDLIHIGSFQMLGGKLVFHMFEECKR